MTSDLMSRKNMGLSGQGSIEWILIVALIAVAIIAGLTAVQGQMTSILTKIQTTLTGVVTP